MRYNLPHAFGTNVMSPNTTMRPNKMTRATNIFNIPKSICFLKIAQKKNQLMKMEMMIPKIASFIIFIAPSQLQRQLNYLVCVLTGQ